MVVRGDDGSESWVGCPVQRPPTMSTCRRPSRSESQTDRLHNPYPARAILTAPSMTTVEAPEDEVARYRKRANHPISTRKRRFAAPRLPMGRHYL